MKKLFLATTALTMFDTAANADLFDLHILQTSSGIDETHSFNSVHTGALPLALCW